MKKALYTCPKCGRSKGYLLSKRIKGIAPQDRQCRVCRTAIVAEKSKNRIPWNKGRPISEETRQKLRLCNLGKPSPTKGKQLSEKTKIKLSCHNRGITIDQFDDFTTSTNEAERVKLKKSNLRQSCFELANFTCDICNKRGVELNAHHADSWSAFPNLRFEISNLKCLCKPCHESFHNKFGRRNNTKEQYLSFKENKNV